MARGSPRDSSRLAPEGHTDDDEPENETMTTMQLEFTSRELLADDPSKSR
jgi:hypothetical protein